MTINKRAILSGALGATASFIAKLALSPDSPVPLAVHSMCIGESVRVNDSPSSSTLLCSSMSLLARGLCLLCTIGTNALMIGSFLDGMNESGSVVGTALSTAANFSCSVSTQRPGGECARIRLRTRDAENHVAATSINIGTFVR
jgi:hypothetical protein